MDTDAIAALATNMSQQSVAQDISIAVFKKAMAAEAKAAMQLITAIPPMPAPTESTGNIINIKV